MADIVFTDHSDEVLRELETKIEAALEACGQQAVSHAKTNITAAGRVDTGALRNSVEHQVDMSDHSVYIGTNQDYAIYNELGTGIYADGGGRQTPWSYQDAHGEWHRTRGMPPIHFLKNSVAGNQGEYRAIMEMILKE